MRNENLTKHAATRGQQRSIDPLHMSLIMTYGEEVELGRGTRKIKINRKGLHRIEKDIKALSQRLEKLGNMYLIESANGMIITAAHQLKH